MRARRTVLTPAFLAVLLLGILTLALLAGGCKATGTPVVPDSDASGGSPAGGVHRGGPTAPVGAGPGAQPVASDGADATATPKATILLKVYFDDDEKMQPVAREVPYTTGVLAAAMKELLAGPTATERAAGLETLIPAGTTLRGVSVANGVATVDLSRTYESGGGTLSMTNRLAQVVFTLTQYPNVSAVAFRLDGKPVTVFSGEGLLLEKPQRRADFEDATPAILVESPAWGSRCSDPLALSGTANVFEGVFQLEVLDASHKVLASKTVHASSGTGTRGVWSARVPLADGAPGALTLRAFTTSAKDGATRENLVEIPLTLAR